MTNATAEAASRWVTGMPAYAGAATPGGHARHDLERHARGAQRLGLLAAAAEHERVAALEPHDPLAGLPELDQQRVDVLLRHRDVARLLADVAQLGVRRARPPSASAGISRS